MSTLTELVKKRRQAGGSVGGSLSYGLKEKVKETFDPRRFFKQDGLLTALFPKLKSYKSGKVDIVRKTIPKLDAPEVVSSEPLLESIQENTKISAKNSMVLPAIHRDINVMRQNIIKLVKLKGVKSTNKADMWFMKASNMEAAYENRVTSRVKKSESKTPTPTKEESKDDTSGFLGQILDKVSGLIKPILGTIASLSGAVFTVVGGVAAITGVALTIGRVLYSLIKVLVGGKVAKILGLSAAILGIGAISNFMDKFEGMGQQIDDYKEKMDSAMATLGGLAGEPGQTNVTGTNETTPTNQPPKKEYSGDLSGSKTIDKMLAPHAETAATASAVGVGVSGAVATKQVFKAPKLATKTAEAILDARTQSVGQLAKSVPKSRWGKFLAFVARKSPKLFGKLALRLAQASALATIPFAGWIGAAIELGFSLWTAWELYELWREFNNLAEEYKDIEGTSPTQEPNKTQSVSPETSPTPTETQNSSKPPLTKDDIKASQDQEKLKKVEEYVRQGYGNSTVDGQPGSRKLTKEELRDKAMKIFGVEKTSGNQIQNATSEVKVANRENMRPQVNVAKTTNTKSVPLKSSNQNIEIASVYDSEFLKLLGMHTGLNDVGAT